MTSASPSATHSGELDFFLFKAKDGDVVLLRIGLTARARDACENAFCHVRLRVPVNVL